MLVVEKLENGYMHKIDGKEFILNIDYKLPKKNKSMFQILQAISYEAQPSDYCSNLSFVPKTLEEFYRNLDKFMKQEEIKKVTFHHGKIKEKEKWLNN